MDFLSIYVNLIRLLIILITGFSIFKRDYKKIKPALIVLAFTFIPWALTLIDFKINKFTEYLYPAFLFLAPFLGSGYRYYDKFSWWDRIVHFISGILFFGFGVSLAQTVPGIGIYAILIFGFILSLAMHEIWEVIEFIADSIGRTDHQHWQKRNPVINHQPKKALQPPGLVDTMSDIIAGIIGAAAAFLGWWAVLS